MRLFAIVAIVFISACSSHASSAIAPQTTNVFPQVVQQQGGGPWVNFPMGGSRVIEPTQAIAAGFDGNMWVCDNGAIDRVDMAGNVTSFAVPACFALTRDPDQHLYFWETPTQFGKVDSSGDITSLSLDGGTPVDNVMASDSNHDLWKPGSDIDRIDPAGHVAFKNLVFPPGVGGTITALAYGSDGQMWFSCVARFTPCLGEISLDMSVYNISLLPDVSNPIAASDGGIWFSEGNSIARMDTGSKTITTYPLPQTYNVIWGTQATPELLAFVTKGRQLLKFNIRTHKIDSILDIPGMVDSTNSFIDFGVDRNLWIATDVLGKVSHGYKATTLDVNVVRLMTTTPTSITVSVGQAASLGVAEKHYLNPTFAAASSNPSVATVAPAQTLGSFVVTGVSSGSCSVTLSDRYGNSIAVSVTVQ